MLAQSLNTATSFSIEDLLLPPISFHKVFAKLAGGVAEGLFLSILWNAKDWVEITYKQWQEEYCLTRREVDAGRKKLKELGLLEEKKEKGANRTVSYRVISDKVLKLFSGTSILVHEVKELSGVAVPQEVDVKQQPLPINNSTPHEVTRPQGDFESRIPLEDDLALPTPVVDPAGWEEEPKFKPVSQYKSSVQKCEDRFRRTALPEWRISPGRNQYKPDFVEYLRTIYLPKTPHYEGREIMKGEVMGWLSLREKDEAGLSQIEAILVDFKQYSNTPAAHAAKVAKEFNLPLWVKKSEAWVNAQYKELIDCNFNLEVFKYTHSQNEINIWEDWIRQSYPAIWQRIVNKKQEMNIKMVA